MLARIVARVNNRYEISECFLRHNQITVDAMKVVNNTLQLAGVDHNMLLPYLLI